MPDFKVTGINQIAWEPATNTLHVESDQLLRQHTTYILVVTTDVRDAAGKRIQSAFFRPHMHGDMSDLVRGLPGKLHLPDVAVATRLHDPERHVAAGEGAPADQGVHPGRRELRDRQRRRADGVPARRRDVGRVLAADRHRADLRRPSRT